MIAAVISLFQFEGEGTTAGEVLAVGLLVGVPVTTVAGAATGWLWGVVFGGGEDEHQSDAPGQGGSVGQRSGGPRRRK